MLDFIVEHQAGIPLVMKPLRGNTSDVSDCGPVVTQHSTPLHILPLWHEVVVVASALYSEANLQRLAHTGRQRISWGPATLTEAQTPLEQATAETMGPLIEGDR